jgi:hypothetical protein
MHLADLLPDAELVLALEPEELGRHILMVLDSWPPHTALQLSTFINTILGHPQTPGAGPYPTNRRGDLQEALSTAWARLEGQALLIADTRYGEGVVKLSPSGKKIARLASSGNPVAADGEISEAGRKARFERWEQLGLDVIRTDLEATGGHRMVGGRPAVRRLAWEWVRMKQAERAGITLSAGAARRLGSDPMILKVSGVTSVTTVEEQLQSIADRISKAPALPDQQVSIPKSPASSERRAELFTLRPGIWGVSVDLKEVGRRVSSRWQPWRGKHR